MQKTITFNEGSSPSTSPSPSPSSSPSPSTSLLTLLLPILLLASACTPEDSSSSSSSSALTVTDPAGRHVTLETPACRVVSMSPAVTEWIIAMGATDRLVARTDYDQQPGIRELPSVGGGLTASIEWLAAREPDLVISWPDAPSRSIVSRLEQVGIPVYTAPVESVDQAFQVARDMGTLIGEESAATAAIAEVRAGLDSVRTAVADRDRPTVLYLIGLDPLMAAGPGTFVDELLDIAGGRNVLHDLDILWPQLSLEEVISRAPDVVIVSSNSVRDPITLLADRPGWREVPAVRQGAVHAVHPDSANRPGPGLDEAAARLAELIHR